MPSLKEIVEKSETPQGRYFDLAIQAMILISLITFSIETLPNINGTLQLWLDAFELFSIIFFSCEYLLRVYVAQPKVKYIFSFLGLVDLLAILPFYFGLGVDLRTLRSLRFLRLVRIFKLVRYNAALRRFHLALNIAKEEIVLFLAATAILLYLGAVGIYYFESSTQPEKFGSVFHCLWWAVATLTTVGYGDVYPITVGGKIFTFVLLILGLGVISVPTGLVASALAKARQMEDEGR